MTLLPTLTQDRVQRNPNPGLSAEEMDSPYPSALLVLCCMQSGETSSSGLEVSHPTMRNSLPPSDLYLPSLIMTLNTRACCSQRAVLYSRATDKQLQMPTRINTQQQSSNADSAAHLHVSGMSIATSKALPGERGLQLELPTKQHMV